MEIPLRLDRSAAQPLYRQIYDQIRQGIETGQLAPGTRLTPTREFAARLGVGRTTVMHAFDRLLAEGFLQSRIGGWIAVASHPPSPSAPTVTRTRSTARNPPRYHLAARMRTFPTMSELPRRPKARVEFDFRGVGTAVRMVEWQHIVARHWATFEARGRLSQASVGNRNLRTLLARYLRAARAVDCTEEQIVLASSDRQALSLIAHLTVGSGDEVLMEDPGKPASRFAFHAYGATVVPVPVDADGIRLREVARSTSSRTRLLYVTPSHQLPTGATLSQARRPKLLAWARSTGALIVEDDWQSAYRYRGATIGSLQGIDPDVVIYVGSLRNVLGGTVEVAHLVVPPALVDAVAALELVIDRGPPPYIESALADFMSSGLLSRQLRRMQRDHRLRRDALQSALRACFGDAVRIGPAPTGTFMHVRWRNHPVSDEMITATLRAGVGLVDASYCYMRPPATDPGVLMWYGDLDEHTISAGVRRLAEILDGMRSS